MSKSIFITGATGFVGGYMVNYFSQKGYKVYASGRKDTFENQSPIEKYVKWDITTGVLSFESKIDVVIHCAGAVSPWGDGVEMFEANVEGAANVLKSFPDAKFIHISTASVYDIFKPKNFVNEDQPRAKKYLNSYQETKWEAEQVVIKNSKNYIIYRPHIIYGPGDTTIYPRLMRAKKTSINRFIVLGNGENQISLTYIGNLAKAVDLGINSDVKNTIFNISDEKVATAKSVLDEFKKVNSISERYLFIPTSVAYFIGLLLELIFKLLQIKKEPVLTRYTAMQMSSNYTLNIDKITKQLNYSSSDNYTNKFYESYAHSNIRN